MKFSDAAKVSTVVWNMRQSDLPRATNRAAIDRLANGSPPLTERERIASGANTNVNFLDLPEYLADSRRTFYGAHLKPAVFFNVTLDYGNPHKRTGWAKTITREINKVMKDSLPYYECVRSIFAMVVEHGIGPVTWKDSECWCPTARAIGDVMIPSDTLLTMENLPHFAIFHQYTPMQLYELTHGKKRDPAWNMDMVVAAIKWAMQQEVKTETDPMYWSPEKWEERIKENPGYYNSDAVPTIDCWSFFFWSNEGGIEGWRKRVVVDTPAQPYVNGEYSKQMPDKNSVGTDQKTFLYCPKDSRIYASTLNEIIHFQFGDASAVAPFKYHAVRSLGWLLYAVCHLQNRLRCKMNDATFESFIQLLRTSNPDDKERVLKVDLHQFGVVPEGVSFIGQNERWHPDYQLAEMTTEQNRQSMDRSAAQFREGRDSGTQGQAKTATQVMAEVNSANALVGAMLQQSYTYSKFQFKEICRRFCIEDSKDPDVRRFRVNVLKAGVPKAVLNSAQWNIEPERVMGNGNKILQVAMADKLMAVRQLLDPEAQRQIDRIYVEANSDQPDLAEQLVPRTRQISDSIQVAKNTIGSLMYGIQIPIAPGLNASEVIETLLNGLATVLKGMGQPTIQEVTGAKNIAQHIGMWIQKLSEDKEAGSKAKQYGKDLAELTRVIDGLEAQLQQQQPEGGGVDPLVQAKVAGAQLQAQTKAQLTEAAGQQKLQHKEIAFQQKTAHGDAKNKTALQQKLDAAAVERAEADLRTAAEIKRADLRAATEPPQTT